MLLKVYFPPREKPQGFTMTINGLKEACEALHTDPNAYLVIPFRDRMGVERELGFLRHTNDELTPVPTDLP